jgi:hypothetical protein
LDVGDMLLLIFFVSSSFSFLKETKQANLFEPGVDGQDGLLPLVLLELAVGVVVKLKSEFVI